MSSQFPLLSSCVGQLGSLKRCQITHWLAVFLVRQFFFPGARLALEGRYHKWANISSQWWPSEAAAHKLRWCLYPQWPVPLPIASNIFLHCCTDETYFGPLFVILISFFRNILYAFASRRGSMGIPTWFFDATNILIFLKSLNILLSCYNWSRFYEIFSFLCLFIEEPRYWKFPTLFTAARIPLTPRKIVWNHIPTAFHVFDLQLVLRHEVEPPDRTKMDVRLLK